MDLTGSGPGHDLVAHLDDVLAALAAGSVVPGSASPVCTAEEAHQDDGQALLDVLTAQLGSRWLDVAARRLHAARRGYYTIASAGHEGNAAVALALRPTDPALLHYRSGAFYLARAAQAGHAGGLLDIALGLVASGDEPIAGGRHKVLGHPDLAVIPQTSTIASHLPRALGIAWTLGRQPRLPERLRVSLAWPDDAVVVASFGDASANHSTAAGAVNAACWAAYQGIPLPLLLVCEDNGLGISARTPPGWVEAAFAHRPGLHYVAVDGGDPLATLSAARGAVRQARTERRPVLLHLTCVRLGGHAGSDAEVAYRTSGEIAADRGHDPVAAALRVAVQSGVLTAAEARERVAQAREDVETAVATALRRPALTTAADVVRPLAPHRPVDVAQRATRAAPAEARIRGFGGRLPEQEGPLTLAQSLNRTLLDAGSADARVLLLGEDVGRKGGVYGVTAALQRRLGVSRVVDTLLDEQSVLGLALGAGISGLLPVAEIQYLAYLHNAEDQLRGEAASLQFFSQGAYRNPLVVRVPGLAYQKGFGGHFHNDNSVGVLRDVPGLVVACPAHPSDAPALLRTCLAAAEADGTVSVVLEPIALYHERDMLTEGDGAWLAPYAPPELWSMAHVPIGRASVWGKGEELTIATYGNGLRLSLRAAATLAAEGIGVRVVDLRWLAPLPVEDVVREAERTRRLLIVDEARRTGGGVAEALVTAVLESGFGGRLARVCAEDSFVPTGPAADLVLVRQETVEATARRLVG